MATVLLLVLLGPNILLCRWAQVPRVLDYQRAPHGRLGSKAAAQFDHLTEILRPLGLRVVEYRIGPRGWPRVALYRSEDGRITLVRTFVPAGFGRAGGITVLLSQCPDGQFLSTGASTLPPVLRPSASEAALWLPSDTAPELMLRIHQARIENAELTASPDPWQLYTWLYEQQLIDALERRDIRLRLPGPGDVFGLRWGRALRLGTQMSFPFDALRHLRLLANFRRARADISLTEAETRSLRRQFQRRVARVSVTALSLALCVGMWTAKPWRRHFPLPESMQQRVSRATLPYLEVALGGAELSERLPIIVALHPLGGHPETLWLRFRNFPRKARLIIPAAPFGWPMGSSWYPVEGAEADTERLQAETIAALAAHVQRERPHLGEPVIVGFAQGAMIAYASAAFAASAFRTVIAVGGTLWSPLDESDQPHPGHRIFGFHGLKDRIVRVEWARQTAERMIARGFDVQLDTYPQADHSPSQRMTMDWRRTLRQELPSAVGRPLVTHQNAR